MGRLIHLYVGDTDEYPSVVASREHGRPQLVVNYKEISDPGVYVASLGDMDKSQFLSTLELADTITYCPPAHWSDQQNGFSYMRHWTEFYLAMFYNQKPVRGLESYGSKNNMLSLIDNRKTQKEQLWISGCSFSHGTGVRQDQRYGQLLSQRLETPVSFLTSPASSVEWAADQILRSDMRKDDLLIWGITTNNRISLFKQGQVCHVTATRLQEDRQLRDQVSLEILAGEHAMYRTLTHIEQVRHMCSRIGVRLVLAGLLVDDQTLPYLYKYPEFIQLYGRFGLDSDSLYLDLGSDGEHPGPAMHRWYYEQIYNKIQRQSS